MPDNERYVTCAEYERLRDALAELVEAGEPFIESKRNVQLSSTGLRIYSRWLAAMIDAGNVVR